MKPAGAACKLCPAREAPVVLPEPAVGRARLAIVGEAPGRNELEQRRPFVGASGRMLTRGLATIGLKRQDVHWTNAVLCACSDKDLPKARKQCAERLRAELGECGAPVIMPVGAYGLQSTLALAKKPQILKWRGSVSELEATGSLVAPTVHPAFVMRAPKWGPVLEVDVERVGRLLELHASGRKWLPPERQPGRRIVVARDYQTLCEELDGLRGDYVGFDVETVGLGPTETRLVCFALSDGLTTVVVPWSKAANGLDAYWLKPPAVVERVNAQLRKRVAITHNGPAFDHIVARRYGIEIKQWDDTLLAAHATASHMPKRLDHVVSMVLDTGPWKQWEDRGAAIDRLWLYNGRDTLYTLLAWLALKDEVV